MDKTPAAGDPGKVKTQPKIAEPKSDPPAVKPSPPPTNPAPASMPENKFKLPANTIGLIFDGIKDGLSQLQPDMIFMTPKKYKEMLDEIEALKKQLKPDRQAVYSCKLTGKVEEANVQLKADIVFVTEQPRTVVPLGFKGAFLVDDASLEQQNLVLRGTTDHGYEVQALKPGRYQLGLTFQAKISQRRTGSATAGGGGERGFDLDLPGAAITSLALELPKNIREIRWNDNVERPRNPARWEISVGSSTKTLEVSWKEKLAQQGSGALLTADGQVTVRLDETSTLVQAELTIEDINGVANEWHLIVPDKAKVDLVNPPTSLVYDIQPGSVDGNKNQVHVIRFVEPCTEKLKVSVQWTVPRPAAGFIPKLPIGPFFVQNAFRQQGTITVQAPPRSLRGQRLIFHRFGDVYQRDLPKMPALPDTSAIFQYWIPKGPQPPKAPIEIEWRAEKGLVETSVEHQLRPRRGSLGLQIDTLTHIKVKSLSAGVDFLDVQLPRASVPHTGLFAWNSVAGFPGGVAWAGILDCLPRESSLAQPMAEFFCQEENNGAAAELLPPDAQGKARIKFLRPPAGKEFLITLEGKYVVPGVSHRVRLELPRPLGIVDRGGKATVLPDEQTQNQLELLEGPASAEEPVPIHQPLPVQLDPSTNAVEFAWRPYRPQFPAYNLTDITLHGKIARVRQQITSRMRPATDKLRLRVPTSVLKLEVISGGKLISESEDREWVTVEPSRDFLEGKPLVVQFDQMLPLKENTAQSWKVPLVWPADALQLEAKVRVWSDPGVTPQPENLSEQWLDLGGDEVVDNRDSLPVLVLQGVGKDLALTLKLPAAALNLLPAFICDRGLIQVWVDDTGLRYRARYLIKKMNAALLDVEFPTDQCNPTIMLENPAAPKRGIKLNCEMERRIGRIKIDPNLIHENMLLDIQFTIAADAEGNATLLTGPVLRGGDFLGRLRWAVSLPPSWVAVVAGRNVQQDFRWSLQGGLITPEPDAQTGDLEKWLTGRDAGENGMVVSQAFRAGQQPILIVHFAKQTWLLLCSGLLLGLGLLLYLIPLRRSLFWLVIVCLGLASVAAGFIWPTWVPPLLYGMQLGLLVLLIGVVVEWIKHERYRRSVVFMPGFTRVKPGSSLLKGSASAPRPREASTVDAPLASMPGRGSSVKGQQPAGENVE